MSETIKSPSANIEILAPAGSMESLQAAVRCGADAVYCGGKSLNARRTAANFGDDELREAVRYCHIRGVRVYLTVNTLVFDRELPELDRTLSLANDAGADAVIVQDLATAKLVRERAPSLELHASTQMAIHDAAGANMLEELGFSRVVLARELSKQEIARIRAECSIGLESFVHGALCMSVSGQCYLSSMLGGRSGNRGLCAQPCRLEFTAGDRDHVLSLRDLSLIPQMKELRQLGIRSLKIEGRMKRPEYVAAAVNACRMALDGEEPDYATLEAAFSRTGFTSGYFDGKLGEEMFGVRRKEDVKSAAPILSSLAKLYRQERQSVPISFHFTLCEGQPAALEATDGDGNRVHITGPAPEEARTAPTDQGRVAAALGKTGGTPFQAAQITSTIDPGLILPAAHLNALRRDALEELTALRGKVTRPPYIGGPLPELPKHQAKSPAPLRVRLSRAHQLTEALLAGSDQIILPLEELQHYPPGTLEQHAHQLMVELPAIAFDRHTELEQQLQTAKDDGIRHALVGNLSGLATAKKLGLIPHGDYSLNITNSLALMEYARLGLADATVSFELELQRIRSLGGELPRGMLVYGHLPLMTTRNCPAGECAVCNRNFPEITDRKGNRFFVDCTWGVSRLHNCIPLSLSDRLGELGDVDFLTLYFTRESPGECAEILQSFREGQPPVGEKTRGLYYRKVF